MNMPPPVASKNYNKQADKLGEAVEKVAKFSMREEVKEAEGSNISMSFDGTSQRRGHSSLNGVGTAISVSTGKIDCATHCATHIPLKESNPEEYDTWKITNEEEVSTESSMETAAAG